MKLISVSEGLQFTVKGKRYSHDLFGSHGGGRMAVVDLDSGVKSMMSGSTEVELVEDIVEPISILDPPQVIDYEMPFELEIPDPDQLVATEEDVKDVDDSEKDV